MSYREETVLLMKFASKGDAEAFAVIIKQYAPLVYGVCLRILEDKDKAADAVQDTFFELVRNAAKISCSLTIWLHRVATNRSIDLLRQDSKRKKHETQYAAKPEKMQSGLENATWHEISGYIDQELNQLDEQMREVLVMHFFRGRSFSEIANDCGISHQTVSRRIESGVAALRHKLKSRGVLIPATALTAMLTENVVKAAPVSVMEELGKIALSGGQAIAANTGSNIMTGISKNIAVKTKAIAAALVMLVVVGSITLYNGFSQSAESGSENGSSSTSAVTNQRDMELLKIVAQANKANYDSIVTWKSDVYEEINSSEGDTFQIKTNVRYEFVFDQSQNAVRWNKNDPDTIRVENGIKTVDPYYALIAYTSKMYKDSAYYTYRGNQQPGTPITFHYQLNIEKDKTGSKRTHQSITDSIDPLKLLSPFSEPAYEGLMFYYEVIKDSDPNVYIYREGDLVTLQFLRNDANDRYVFDLSKGGNIVLWSNEDETNKSRNTNKYTYEKKADSWVLKTYEKYHYDTTWGVVRTSTRLLKFENSVVNVPFEDDEFTIEKLGIKNGDMIQDSTSGPPLPYIYRGT